jgi:hypothetical protein
MSFLKKASINLEHQAYLEGHQGVAALNSRMRHPILPFFVDLLGPHT